eukprot:4968207-Amphidinium_carterae.1
MELPGQADTACERSSQVEGPFTSTPAANNLQSIAISLHKDRQTRTGTLLNDATQWEAAHAA